MPLQEDSQNDTPPPTPPSSKSKGLLSRTTIDPLAHHPVTPEETVKLSNAYYSTRVAQDAPLSVAFNFPRVLVAGSTSSCYVEIRNLGTQLLDPVELTLESRGLAAPVIQTARLEGNQALRLLVPLEPARNGCFVLQCTVKITIDGQLKAFIGARSLWINAPVGSSEAPDLQHIQTNRFIPPSPPATEPVPQLLQQIPGANSIQNLEDLLKFKLPDQLTQLSLSYDYQVSLAAVEHTTTHGARHLIIYQLFLGYVQAGTLLKLTPRDPTKARPMHLVARPAFKIGRSRDPAHAADFITWFIPRGKLNDEKTKHLGRVHVVAECQGGLIYLRDTGSVGGSAFDGQPLPVSGGEPLSRRGVLTLAAEYFLDVQPMPSAYEGDPGIKNITLWKGPTAPAPECRGAVRFSPINSELAHHDAVWLFTDATFGTSRSNSIVLSLPGLAEIQGRFHHYRGCFWVENRVGNEAVSINSRPLNNHEIAPLMNGLILQLGQVSFQVEVQT